MSIPAKHTFFAGALATTALVLVAGTVNATDDTGPECRGVAAGVVAAMRSAGELKSEEATTAAIVAARRACSAAREDLGAPSQANAAAPAPASSTAAESEKETSVWDFLTGDTDRKPGNERLRRLKTQ